jgi:hypothetical protein
MKNFIYTTEQVVKAIENAKSAARPIDIYFFPEEDEGFCEYLAELNSIMEMHKNGASLEKACAYVGFNPAKYL